MSKRVESMQIGLAAVDEARAEGYWHGRLAALKEVREMIDHRIHITSDMTTIRNQELMEMRNRIDAMIAKEEDR